MSHLNYQLLSWGYNYSDIFKLQKKAIRAVTLSHPISHTDPLFKQLKLLKLPDLHTIVQMKFLHKFFRNELPSYFMQNFLCLNNEVHNHATRNNDKFNIPHVKHEFAKLIPRFSMAKLCNSLPPNILDKFHSNWCLKTFIRYYKKEIVAKYSLNCQILNCYVCGLPQNRGRPQT